MSIPTTTYSPAGLSTSTTYPYGAYHHGAYSQTPGAYPFQTGVTGYGWTYPYSYYPHPVQTPGFAPQPAAPVPAQNQANASSSSAQQRVSTVTATVPTYAKDTTSGTTMRGARKQANFKGLFSKELKSLMYGFGDDRNPASDTVNVMEEILIEYITDVCQTAGASSRKSRLSIEDLRRALSRPADAKKLARMEELLFMQEDIKRARAQFLEPDAHNPNDF